MHSSFLRAGATRWLSQNTHIGTCSSSAGSKHEGLHPPRKLAAKTTWLWGLVGKQGTEASLRDIDSSHLHWGACHRLPVPASACQRLSSPSPADTLSSNADIFGFKLYAEKPLGQFTPLLF